MVDVKARLRRVLLGCVLAAATVSHAQEPAEIIRLVDSPTAGLVDKGRFAVDLRMFSDGGLSGQLHAGILRRISIGLSFGGQGIIGNDAIDWYPRVEANARYRVIEESQGMPAITVGYETQGYGPYHPRRYQIKSKGMFTAFSKNYLSSLGQFGAHGGVNLSREDEDDGDFSGWVGVDKSINEELFAVVEYDFALNDNDDESLGSGRGFLNVGGHWSPVAELSIGLLFKNILENGDADIPGGPDPDLSRELSVRYTERF
ncbi:MAG: hypothetical protein VX733_07470 [Candidatus Latescibacterota bacterium]|nr:hypothetical protein [Candidatus Latescibacterota bacterium]